MREALERSQLAPLGPIRTPEIVDVYWEEPCPSGLDVVHSITRRDALGSRTRWQFADRVEYYATMKAPRAQEG